MLYCFGCNQPYQNNKSLTLHLKQSIFCSASIDQNIPETTISTNGSEINKNLSQINISANELNDIVIEKTKDSDNDEITINNQGSFTGTNNESIESDALMDIDNC